MHVERHFICHMLNSFGNLHRDKHINIQRRIHQAKSHRRVCQYRKSLWKTILEHEKTCRLDQNQYEIDPKMIAKNLWIFQDGSIFEQHQELPLENILAKPVYQME